MSENKYVKQMLGKVFHEIADGIETGNFGKKYTIGLTLLGSEHGVENMVQGAERAYMEGVKDIVLIGTKVDTHLPIVEAGSEQEAHEIMEKMLDSGQLDACVTMHYSFPIGVSTVGKVYTPATGKNMFIATTTGVSDTSRTEAMIKNAIYGIIAAKANGVDNPSVGILNVDNARAVERALKQIQQNGYPINIGQSARSDGGAIMRGNDLLMGSVDVMVTDSLTGNILMKMFSAYATGGNYEASGFGYGPGIGEGYGRNILILSRASGIPVVANAIHYAYDLARGNVSDISKNEFDKVNEAGYQEILRVISEKSTEKSLENIIQPTKEVVTSAVSGIDIMDLDDAVQNLWKAGIYAESGMGCTGPIIMVSDNNLTTAVNILSKAGYISTEGNVC